MTEFKTPQESFWAGEFGDAYSKRVAGNSILAAYTALHARILKQTRGVHSIIEFGANIGMNLQAYRRLLPEAELSAIEINPTAIATLKENPEIHKVYEDSILEFEPDYTRDLVLIKTVLIHINPDELPRVYDRLFKASGRYICVAEYYNPEPTTTEYRGHSERLFKRDFAGEMLDRFSTLELVDYGFVYHRDPTFPIGDVSWFLLEKVGE